MDTASPQYMVFQALEFACSQDTVQLKQAEAKLAEWETEPGFYTTLLRIFSDHSIPVNVRWMAAVYFKNGINKYWRRNCHNEISQSEKASLRSALMTSFREPVPQVAVQIATLIARIARFDWPKEWPEIIPTLLDAVQNTTQTEQHRSLLVLQHVVKELASKRFMNDRRMFSQMTQNVYPFILNLWDGFTTLYFQSLRENLPTQVSHEYIEKALLCLRILRKLTNYGFYRPHSSEECMMFIKSMFPRLKESLEYRLQLKQATIVPLIELTEKFILKQMKILNEFLEIHPLSFIDLIPTVLEFSFNYVFNEGTNLIFENNEISFENFAIHCINLMKGILTSTTQNSYVHDDAPKDQTPPAVAAKMDFFTPIRLNYICEKVIMHYFLLTQNDFELWDDDPEAFASDEGGDPWKYALRPCTETFFWSLFCEYRQDIIPEMVKYIRKAQETILTPDSDLKIILAKDAVYNAAGLSAFNLFDEIDFSEWFTNQLVNEMKLEGNQFRIIRRRIIWLVGKWFGVKFDRTLRPQVYTACLHLLRSEEDMCVRLAASKTLMATINDFEFESTVFLEYLEPSISLLFTLLKEVKECDTKMNVLHIMSMVVDKMSDNIVEKQADNLIRYLPLLWEESRDHNMLRCAIISTLVQVVKALSEVPLHLVPFLYPVIGISTNKNEPSHVYLLEEGLELWIAVVENSTTLNTDLLELSSNIFTIIENSSENLRTALYIIQTYIILNPTIYLQRFGKDIVKSCTYLLSDLRPEGIVAIMKLFEIILRAKPDYGIEILRPAFGNIFRKVYENGEYPLEMVMYITIVARVLIYNQMTFIQVLQELNIPRLLETILDVWIAQMPLVSQQDKTKLLSLALASLLTVQNDIIYERFSSILISLCESLNDIMQEDEDSGGMVDSLILTDETFEYMCMTEEFDYKSYHYERFRQLCQSDPVYSINLKDYVESQVNILKTQLGIERFNQFVSSVDEAVLKNLAEHISIEIPSSQPK